MFNNAFITDVQEKADLFNNYFAQQCTLLDGSCLPPFMLRTEKTLIDVPFDDSDILAIINNLKPDKAHGWDGISIRMIQMCGDSIITPLSIIFKNCISQGVFPSVWKKANVVPIHKKDKKIFIQITARYHFYLSSERFLKG